MKKTVIACFVAFAAVSFSGPSFAQEDVVSPVENHKTMKKPGHFNRIYHGIKNGELTIEEARALFKAKKREGMMRKEMRSDGVVTAEERKKIRKVHKKNSIRIYKEKHNAQRR